MTGLRKKVSEGDAFDVKYTEFGLISHHGKCFPIFGMSKHTNIIFDR